MDKLNKITQVCAAATCVVVGVTYVAFMIWNAKSARKCYAAIEKEVSE